MSTRYIQAAISSEDHKEFAKFALEKDVTLSTLIGIAVKEFIKLSRKEEAEKVKRTQENLDSYLR